MENIPQWILDYLINNNFECPHCDAPFKQQGIEAVSLRHAYACKEKTVLYVEYLCHRCDKKTRLELVEMSFEEFALNILSEVENMIEYEATAKQEAVDRQRKKKKKPAPKAKRRGKRSKITPKEAAAVRGMLKKSGTHIEWLKMIGAEEGPDTPEGKFRIIIPQVEQPKNDQDQ